MRITKKKLKQIIREAELARQDLSPRDGETLGELMDRELVHRLESAAALAPLAEDINNTVKTIVQMVKEYRVEEWGREVLLESGSDMIEQLHNMTTKFSRQVETLGDDLVG